MSYELIITEKPSAAVKIAYSLADSKPVKKTDLGVSYYLLSHDGQDIIIVPAVGHLFGVSEKKSSFEYPSFEIEWQPTYETNNKAGYTKKYANAIKKLSQEAKSFTVACDYDIEGEVIGLNCIRFLCKQKDGNRMKFSALTKPDLVSAYENKAKTLNWGQGNAGETRHFLDWLYGINISRALTIAIKKRGQNKTLSTGRVQGPALKLIVDKEKEIKSFKPTPYWRLQLKGMLKNEGVEAWHEKDRFSQEKEVNSILERTKGKNGVVNETSENNADRIPPFAFDLTTLQTEAYRCLKISPKQTLSIAQNLYLGGLISYPRTSSQKLPPTIGYKKILESIKNNDKYSKICNEILSKETIYPRQGAKDDPAHPAIYPTGNYSSKLKPNEEKVFDLIVRRFLSAFGETAKRIETTIKIMVEEEIFITKATSTIEKGWFRYYDKYITLEDKKLPQVKTGDLVDVKEINKLEKETEPPRRYSPASIIKELEKRALGTKSTRAQIIDTLYQRNYIRGSGQLEATIMGIRVVETLLKYSPKIVDEELTKRFEEDMDKIREDKKTKQEVLEEAKKVLTEVLTGFKEKEKEIGSELLDAQKETFENDSIGPCPNCEGTLAIRRGKFGRFIACNRYPECETTFNIPKTGFIESSGNKCKDCGVPTILVKFKGRSKQEVCINPKCPSKKNDVLDETEEKPCPKCKNGILKLRSSMYGQFYGCSNYPKCKYTEKVVNKK